MVADGPVPAFVHQVGDQVMFGDPVRVRIVGEEYTAPTPRQLDSFLGWVRGAMN